MQDQSHPRAIRRDGFTLVEVTLVVLIVGIMAAVATPRFSAALASYRVKAAASRLVADLKYAATLARVTSRELTIEFDKGDGADESEYRFVELPDPNRMGGPFDVADASTWYTIVLRDEPYEVLLQDAPGSITYDIYGMPKSSESFVIVNGAAQRTIDVDETSGEITVQ